MSSDRYSRQVRLQEVDSQGQERLRSARVLCIGAGGLGSPVALYLAAAGVGKLGIVDSDHVEISNLQRQILFRTSDAGRSKVEAAREHLLKLNNDVQIEVYHERFCVKNALEIASGYDVLIDGSDNFETKFLASDVAHRCDIPYIYGAVNGFEGHVALFHGSRGPCYRCLFPAPPTARVRNCAETGVLGAVVGSIGTLQAVLALQFLISKNHPGHRLTPPVGDLSVLDLLGKWNIRTLRVAKNPSCITCSLPAEAVSLVDLEAFCAVRPTITYKQLEEVMGKREQVLLLDVRSTEEWERGHLTGAKHWPLDRLEEKDFPADIRAAKKIVAYCRSGVRSSRAVELFLEAGIHTAFSLRGGMESFSSSL